MGTFGSGDKISTSQDLRKGVSDSGTLLDNAAFQFIGSSSGIKAAPDYSRVIYVAIAIVGVLWLVNLILKR